ncbi:MAG: hypothetical protein HQ555_07830 [Candidatus Aminicenantes bacterium]|nr:hypothetical protein [Candidatus Aminicenantes bacterium]
MGKNQNNKEKNNHKTKRGFLSNLTALDWIVIVIFIVLILLNIAIYIFIPEQMNPLSSLLFQLLQLVFALYIAFRLAFKSVADKTTEVQKSIAKTAIRQIRGSQLIINNLIKIVKLKVDALNVKHMKEILNDLINHLDSLSVGIASSEFAFKDILGEELKEEYLGLLKIRELETKLVKRVKELEKISKKSETNAKKQISDLEDEISDLRSKISSDISSLPITGSVNYPVSKHVDYSREYPWMITTDPSFNVKLTSPTDYELNKAIFGEDIETEKEDEENNKKKKE